MIRSKFPRLPTVWSQLPGLWKFAVLAIITLYTLSLALSWIGAYFDRVGYWFPVLLTPVWGGGMIILISMVTERRRYY